MVSKSSMCVREKISLRYVVFQQTFHELVLKTKQEKRGAICSHWNPNALPKYLVAH